MGFATLVTVTRGAAGATKATHVPLRFDNVSPIVAAQMGGASPYNTYRIESMAGVPDIQTADQLMDEYNIDAKTGNNVLYRVLGNPEVYDQSYLECLVEKIVGKVPA